MSKDSNFNILKNPPRGSSSSAAKTLRRYQLSWNPSFTNSTSKVYVLGENIVFSNGGTESIQNNEGRVLNPSLQDIIDLGLSNGIVLPLNTNIALAQEYAPSIKNKVITYETVGGNSITTFGEAIKAIALRIRIIRLSQAWNAYYKGLEALSYLSGNQTRYYGGLYLTGYDAFDGENLNVSYRYKVTIMSLDFNFKSESNTSVLADLKMVVNQDLSRSRRKWGQL
jgi:hypothetical protein